MSDTPPTKEPIQPTQADASAGESPEVPSASHRPEQQTPAPLPTAAPVPVGAGMRPELDLSLGAAYWGPAFTDIEWNWPSVVRAAIALSDYLATDADRQLRPLLPGRISLDKEGQLRVGAASADEAALFTAPEILESAAAPEDDGDKKKKKAPPKIVPPTAAVYHIGAVAYYLLVGHPPVGNFIDIERAAPATPDALKDALLRALAVDAGMRTPTPAELRAQLYFVLDPPAWFEKAVPRLPVDDELKARLIDTLNRAQLSWYRVRDRIPWQRVDKARKRYEQALAHRRWGAALRLAGVLLLVLVYLLLLTDAI